MNERTGTIERISSEMYIWKLGRKMSNRNWISNVITCPKSSNDCFFHLERSFSSQCHALLFFKNFVNESVCDENYDFVIACKFLVREERFVYENVKPEKYLSRFCFYRLGSIKVNNLQKITCTIFKRDESTTIDFLTDTNELVEEGESSKETKHEEEAITTEKSKRMETMGLDTLSKNLKEAFLSQEDCDVTVNVGDKKYAAHKVILRNRSPVFHKAFQHDMIEKNEASIDICDCDPEIFGEFLLYLYTGRLESMSKESVFKLYYMSDKYEVNDLKLYCIDFIIDNLDIDIICDVIILATRHLELEMLQHAITYFTCNAKDIFLTTKWPVFIKEYPIQANELIIKAFNKKSTSECSKNSI